MPYNHFATAEVSCKCPMLKKKKKKNFIISIKEEMNNKKKKLGMTRPSPKVWERSRRWPIWKTRIIQELNFELIKVKNKLIEIAGKSKG
jgi:hypothetical protein